MKKDEQKAKIKKTILSGIAIFLILSATVYFLSGNLTSIVAVSIVVLIAILRFVIPDIILLWKNNK